MTEYPVSCNKDCGGGCALVARVEGGRVTAIVDSPFRPGDMRGCARGFRAHEVTHSRERLTKPLIRTGPRGNCEFREAPWDEALDLVARRLQELRERHGSRSILALAGAGAIRGAVHNTGSLTRRFLSTVAGDEGYTGTYGSYSSAAQSFVLPFLFGRSDVGIDPATLEESRLLLLWGANAFDTRFGADLETVLRRIRRRGVPCIVVDPRRSRTARELEAEWIAVNPGTDAALMSAILHVLVSEGLVDRSFLAKYSSGFDLLEARVLGRAVSGEPSEPATTPEWAETITGVRAEIIRDLARRYAAAKPAALLPGLSIQRTIGGEEAVRLAVALQAATGNIGVPGGAPGVCTWGLLPTPRFPRIGATAPGTKGASRSVSQYRYADAILGGEPFVGSDGGPIRAAYIVGANYLATGSDIGKNIRAFESLEFSVCHDYLLTPTARYCDVVFPATTFLEREDVLVPAGNYLFYSAKAIDPVGESRNDYDIFTALSQRLGVVDSFTEGRSASDWLEALMADSAVDDPAEFRRTGVFDGGEHRRIGLAPFHRDPAANPLPTASGRIELVSEAYAAAGGPAVPEYRGAIVEGSQGDAPKSPLRLVTPHARFRINSQYAGESWALRAEPQRLSMHPADAAARSIRDGDRVVVESDVGRVEVQVEVTEAIKRGVVSLAAGMWPGMTKAGAKVDPSGAPNHLTSTEPTRPSGGSRTHTVQVEIARE
jgi:anaerobic dimethyl sulfoxide reductase subunit A